MRIFPFALIAIGVVGVLKHFGWIDPEFMRLFWPLLLIAVGLAMLIAGPRWRAQARERMHERWEHRMHRRFGAGWNSLSEEERERFRAGMNHWHGPGRDNRASGPASDEGAAVATVVAFPARSARRT